MIHLAIWLISAAVVLYFAYIGLGLTVIILSEGRWKYVLGIIVVIVAVIVYQSNSQQKEWNATQSKNKPLQENCISNLTSQYNQGVANLRSSGKYTQSAANLVYNAYQGDISKCKLQYPSN